MATDPRFTDGLTEAALTIRAHQLLSTVCVRGGVDCPLMPPAEAQAVLQRVRDDPSVTIRLDSDADHVAHYTALRPDGWEHSDPRSVLNRKRDLDVLQRLGLVPGAIRRARYLYTLLLERIASPVDICAHTTSGWEGCAQVAGHCLPAARCGEAGVPPPERRAYRRR